MPALPRAGAVSFFSSTPSLAIKNYGMATIPQRVTRQKINDSKACREWRKRKTAPTLGRQVTGNCKHLLCGSGKSPLLFRIIPKYNFSGFIHSSHFLGLASSAELPRTASHRQSCPVHLIAASGEPAVPIGKYKEHFNAKSRPCRTRDVG